MDTWKQWFKINKYEQTLQKISTCIIIIIEFEKKKLNLKWYSFCFAMVSNFIKGKFLISPDILL